MASHRWFSGAALVAGVFLAAACAPTIRSERDDNIPVPHDATWAWSGPGAPASAAAREGVQDSSRRGRYIPEAEAYDPIAQQRFRRAIEAAMEAKGFRKVEEAAPADFLLSFSFDGADAYHRPAPVRGGVAMSFYGGWGYGGWGFRPWGLYRPWGWYAPWGFGNPWGWGFAFYPYAYAPAYPYYGGRSYRDGWLTVQLRLRSDGETAWVGRYRTEEHEMREMSQTKLREVVGKLFDTLH